MAWSDIGDTLCPIARALAVVGDRWTVLILRELFLGARRFEDFQTQTGVSPHLLSTRLKRLERDGIVARQKYTEHPPRYEYRLTDKGLDLYPMLLALKSWGEKWGECKNGTAPALVIIHRRCGKKTGLKVRCQSCDEPFGARDATVIIGKAFAEERRMRCEVA